MRLSQMLLPTLRETPAEAEVVSHKLLLRAGMMRKSAAGIYTYLPLGYRVIRKIEEIVREEMDRQGGQEMLLPIVQPAELWQESGRWEVYGDEMFRLHDRHQRDFCLGPTHEEILTDIVRTDVRSYKQLPQLLYQIQNKYRDERRPRFGLMRCREFIMKDLYSFDRDEAGLDISYGKMYEAYCRVFSRCGLDYRAVEADSGPIGGNVSHEFVVLADSGESRIFYCSRCDYAANEEIAPCQPEQSPQLEPEAMEPVLTPHMRTIEDLAAFLQLPAKRLIKTLFFEADGQPTAVLVRGDRELNETKLKNTLKCIKLDFASEETVQRCTGADVGFVGPVGLTGVRIVADLEVPQMTNAVVGANRNDYHLINVNPGRDFAIDLTADLRTLEPGEPCPKCGEPLESIRGIEVGHIFKLGKKYSRALNASFLDENGKEQLAVMGCYGIGISRTMAAAIEQNYDEDGIIWPVPIAPYHVVVVPVSTRDPEQMRIAEQIYRELLNGGCEVVLDDRNERPGVKFKDADLVGYPFRLTVGSRAAAEGTVEIRSRKTGETVVLPVDRAAAAAIQMVTETKAAFLSID